MLSSAIIQNNGKLLCFGFLVRKLHKHKLCLVKQIFEKNMNFELLYLSIRNDNDGIHTTKPSALMIFGHISACIILLTFSPTRKFGNYFVRNSFGFSFTSHSKLRMRDKNSVQLHFHLHFCTDNLTTERVFYFDFRVPLQWMHWQTAGVL